MKKSIKNIIIGISSCIAIMTFNNCYYASAYCTEKHGWVYKEETDNISNGRSTSWNYYDDNGNAKEGWFLVDNKWYYADQIHEDSYYGIYIDKWAPEYIKFYKDDNNIIINYEEGPYDYYCGSDGAMKTGWFKAYAISDYNHKNGLKWYYAMDNGKILKNQYTPDGYYVNKDGIYTES